MAGRTTTTPCRARAIRPTARTPTAEDMLKFAEALLEGRLLGKTYTDLVMTGKVDTPKGKYACGFEDLSEGGLRAVGHSGGAPGVSAYFCMFPDHGYTVVILSNYEEGARAPNVFDDVQPEARSFRLPVSGFVHPEEFFPDEFQFVLLDRLQRRFSVLGFEYGKSVATQKIDKDSPDFGFVFGDQNRFVHKRTPSRIHNAAPFRAPCSPV